ncbi:ABC transporter permease [Candidatus Adlerbacteria bacterium RIFCSPHIGHO2_01_FULL_54_23]|uniref:Transport permease protein n=3 Tax=Candidatus Adleribacteriota TaxID=1752736 RepID=A0A1F4Y0W5_9BACT|nr:MAG: Inner membrane transport permease [Candidatus Adlerbacteria bacterium GW2011_GWA1_54_10]KKW37951.1 MAG: Inner membrane transport permease [Candidatus Adlerbacteria bacterium GW2011_GWB1_54_7]OGC78559.1 MAG: ABC transporter permease [Candidatus Adlerbacteria bacterium RIFCSPHIGHO2_01_FULL_54_23]OGC87569.1 MAG: ABC transporter permease [Candidatus Adlerbacteria bacterium RIFCSPLOWO2_01_FULL_54_16]
MTPYQIWISYSTIMRKEFVRIMRIWSQTLLPPVITSSLYFIVFGGFIGSQLAPIDGYSYMQFIVPGLIMMSVITSAYTNTVSTFYFAKFVRNIEEILVSPTPDWVVVAGFVSGGVMRGLMVGALVLVVSLFFTHLAIFNIAVLLAVILLTAILFSLAGLINGVFAKGFDGISIVPTFVLTPLTYLGGIFYSIEQFPQFWQNVSLANPILYMVNAFRYGFLGITDISLWICFAVLLGMSLFFILVVLYLFREGIGVKH